MAMSPFWAWPIGFTSMDPTDLDLENPDLPTTYDESKDESTDGGVAGDGGNGWDGEGKEGDDD